MKSATSPLIAGLLLAFIGMTSSSAAREDSKAIRFERDIRPILSEACVACHGPDEADRKASLRLDTESILTDKTYDGRPLLVPGKPEESELFRRITASNPAERMPPPSAHEHFNDSDIESIRQWIEDGATWRPHWSFITPTRPEPPPQEGDSEAHPIDRFIDARLAREGLEPAPSSSRATWLRRVTLTLTGILPSLEELDRFLADDSPTANDTVLDRLLSSPRYGEHMARYWLDAARYGDTHGLHLDNERSMWPYRDWVIRAFNENMPFDQFTIEQLAGDLLEEPTPDQVVATGFNRCNPTTGEGGLIEDEYLFVYAADRVETTATVWMGLSMSCARCHDHKFDPISQSEFYSLFAFFNSIDERGNDLNALAPPPTLTLYTDEDRAQLATFASKQAEVEQEIVAPIPEVDAAQAVWERECRDRLDAVWTPIVPLQTEANTATHPPSGPSAPSSRFRVVARTHAESIRSLRFMVLPGEGALSLTSLDVRAISLLDPDRFQDVAIGLVTTDREPRGDNPEALRDDDPRTAWAPAADRARILTYRTEEPFTFEGGTVLEFEVGHQGPIDEERFRFALTDQTMDATVEGPWSMVGPFPASSGKEAFETAYPPESEVDLEATYLDGTLSWTTIEDFPSDSIHRLSGVNCASYYFRTLTCSSPRTYSWSLGSDDSIIVWLNGEIVLSNSAPRGVAPDQEFLVLSLDEGPNEILIKVVNYGGDYALYQRPAGESWSSLPSEIVASLETDGDWSRTTLRDSYRREHWPLFKELDQKRRDLAQEQQEYENSLTRAMVMRERDEPRPAHVLIRGQYDQPGPQVDRGTPSCLPPLEPEAPKNRLTLARWLVDDDHPLTARVFVNRIWQQHFGRGIVSTPEDFGTRGAFPTHPDLLDWLATTFVESGWDLKQLHRSILSSKAYARSSVTTPEQNARDPHNALLSRGPRFRCDAEMVRDNALYLGGLLVESVGGPSVKPYQPDGLWKVVAYPSSNTASFKRDDGNALYRRSIYTFWKRTSPPPSMQAFDAPNREACMVNRERTNTPLQALVMLNDVQFVEAARGFATRIAQLGLSDRDALSRAFREATSRTPNETELGILLALLTDQRVHFKNDIRAAERLISQGETPTSTELSADELAAWTIVASTLLNLSETMTQG